MAEDEGDTGVDNLEGIMNQRLIELISCVHLAADHEAQGANHPLPDIPLLPGVTSGPDVGGQGPDHVLASHLARVLQT